MSQSEQKVVQYLNEAHASEVGLVSVLRSQIAISPPGPYREGLEKHLDETRGHARRLRDRLGELGPGGNPFQAFVGLSEAVIGQMVALSKAPFDLWRGASGAEKVLKNAKDACATEALEIATYTALEQLAVKVGDAQTARLAASIRGDEERMLKRLLQQIPELTEAVVQAEVEHRPDSEITPAGAADALRQVARPARKAVRANKPPRAETPRADKTPRTEKTPRAERTPPKTQASAPSTSPRARPAARSEEPWPGYDELTVAEIEAVLNEGDLERAQAVAAYERAHKNRPEVIRSAVIPARFLLSAASR